MTPFFQLIELLLDTMIALPSYSHSIRRRDCSRRESPSCLRSLHVAESCEPFGQLCALFACSDVMKFLHAPFWGSYEPTQDPGASEYHWPCVRNRLTFTKGPQQSLQNKN